ncbi:MAG: N-acetyltransferase [Herbinix sp.]|nr:N-acetyltransferase [Herbinix sp.]
MLEYYFKQLGLSKLIGAVHPENNASIRVIEKLGLKRVGTISGLSEEHSSYNGEYLYSIGVEDYVKR